MADYRSFEIDGLIYGFPPVNEWNEPNDVYLEAFREELVNGTVDVTSEVYTIHGRIYFGTKRDQSLGILTDDYMKPDPKSVYILKAAAKYPGKQFIEWEPYRTRSRIVSISYSDSDGVKHRSFYLFDRSKETHRGANSDYTFADLLTREFTVPNLLGLGKRQLLLSSKIEYDERSVYAIVGHTDKLSDMMHDTYYSGLYEIKNL